jgi:flavodoxin
MKKIFVITLSLMIFLSLIACGNNTDISGSSIKNNNKDLSKGKKRTLVVYFSQTGNTAKLADQIHKIVGGDITEIKTTEPYPENFDTLVKQARHERETGYKPPIKPILNEVENYDVIYLGFPIWGSTIPPAISSFLSKYDLSGKIIIPFCTHDGYGKGRSFEAISEYSPNSIIFDVFEIVGKNVEVEEENIIKWLQTVDNNINTSITKNTTPIIITAGDVKISGSLNNTKTANEFIKTLPQKISMVRYGDREYYGPSPDKFFSEGELKRVFENGEITYCPANNTVAVFFAQTDRPNLTMSVISMGKVFSDLKVFDNMDDFVEMEIALAK